MPLRMSEGQLLALIAGYESACYGEQDGTLARDRAAALDRYNGELLGNEIQGRSSAVSTDLRDTVETVIPQILRIFLSGDETVRFDPTGPDDERAAKQETDYINFVFHQHNNAYCVLSTWFRDALLQKNGYIKTWWEERRDILMESYDGLTDDALSVLLSDPCVEIAAQTSYPDPYFQPPPQQAVQGMMQQPPPHPQIHDVRVRRLHSTGFVRVDNVPCEEILVHSSHRGVSLEDCVFVEHRTNKTLSEIRQMGFDIPDDWAGDELDATNSSETMARDRFDEISLGATDSADPALRVATYREVFARIDEDGDGIAELRRICIVGQHILLDEETDLIPFAVVTPVIQPHRHIGYGYYDFLAEIEDAHTALLRIFFDNNYLSVNGRYAVDVNTVNVDDMLVSRPGGLVRVVGNPGNSIFPITHPSTGESALAAMQYLDAWKKQATGVVMDAQVLSSDVLNKSTATGISQAISVWQARVEAVARSFAETGVRELFRIMHALTLKNATASEKVRINQQWVTVDPREWVKRTNMTVSVGLGTGSKELKVQFLQQLLQMQESALRGGLPLVQPGNLYESSKELLKEMGYKDPDRFLTDPSLVQPQPQQPPPEIQVAQIKAQADQQTKQMELQASGIEAQAKAQAQKEVEAAQMQADIMVAKMQAQFDAQSKALETQFQMRLEAFKASQEQETQIRIAEIKAFAELESARIKASQTSAETSAESLAAQAGIDTGPDPIRELAASIGQLAAASGRPKTIIRGPDGRANGIA